MFRSEKRYARVSIIFITHVLQFAQEEVLRKQQKEEERIRRLKQLRYDFQNNEYTYDFQGNLVQVHQINLSRLPQQTKQLVTY